MSKTTLYLSLFLCFYMMISSLSTQAQEAKEEPVIVNADTVQYFTEKKEVSASGNVKVTYKGSTLTCQKLVVNTQTKDAQAEGNARLDDQNGVVEGSKIIYNFNTKVGVIFDSEFRANPYFGKAERTKKLSEEEFVALYGYATTCDYNNPHYRIKSRKTNIIINDKIQTRDDTFYVGGIPLFYIPQYNHSLKDPLMHVQFMPGKRKEWGRYMLSAWRYNLTDNFSGRIYLDYREKLGVAEGFGTNYNKQFGKGDFKYYYTQERARNFKEGDPAEFQRYFIRWRHKWDISKKTNLTAEYYKIIDSKRMLLGSDYNVLKDYFFREYEKDTLPLTYALLHHNFNNSSMDFIMQKRVNRWYTQLEKLPEIKYSLPEFRIAETPFYFENTTEAANFNSKGAVPSSSVNDVNMKRLDTTHKLSLPLKLAFIRLKPFVKNRETLYDKDIFGSSIPPRTVFYAGSDASTKIFRIFKVKSNFLGMDINGLKHIITPTLEYGYNHEPSIPNSKLKQIDGVDSIQRANAAGLKLSNKLQTKRKDKKVDILDFRISNTYTFKPKGGRGSNFSDFLFELDILPYSWMRIDTDATYNHFKNKFTNANADINFDFGKERSLGIGQRYQRKGGNEITMNLKWRFNPKWRISVYQRRNRGRDPTLKRGLREQEYTIARDLHCWTAEFTYNVTKGKGEAVWLVLRLKAFPEIEFEYNQGYHAPKPGSQSNP